MQTATKAKDSPMGVGTGGAEGAAAPQLLARESRPQLLLPQKFEPSELGLSQ